MEKPSNKHVPYYVSLPVSVARVQEVFLLAAVEFGRPAMANEFAIRIHRKLGGARIGDGQLHRELQGLVRKSMLTMAEEQAVRRHSGKPTTRHYGITQEGIDVLCAIRLHHQTTWAGVALPAPGIATNKIVSCYVHLPVAVGRVQEVFLLAALEFGGPATANEFASIVSKKLGGKRIGDGQLHRDLECLTSKSMLEMTENRVQGRPGKPTARYYEITPEGIEALRAVWNHHQAIWKGVVLPAPPPTNG